MSDLFFTVHLHTDSFISCLLFSFGAKPTWHFTNQTSFFINSMDTPSNSCNLPFFFFYSNTGFNPSLRFRILIALSSGAFSWEQWKIWLGLLAYLFGQTLLQKSKALEVTAHALLKSITNVGQ